MRSKSIIGLVVLILFGSFYGWQLSLKSRYDNARSQVAPSVLAAKKMAEADQLYLDIAKESWKLQSAEAPDSAFAEIANITDLDETVAGVVELYTHQLPEYSLLAFWQNGDESVMASTMAIALPTSVDGTIYVKEGVAYVRVSSGCVELFEDTADGLRRSIYMEPKDEEPEALESE